MSNSKLAVVEIEPDIYSLRPEPFIDTKKYAFIAITHGNEISGLGVFITFIQMLFNDEMNLVMKYILYLVTKNPI
ncbi:MAG: hypothetical protein HON32_01915 [Francisellaceae bacterium]|nr:hypothetical protein [Francisellaceae bacterium]MBT6539141.1 hypothetical protein [Francisellaceae bacterium]